MNRFFVIALFAAATALMPSLRGQDNRVMSSRMLQLQDGLQKDTRQLEKLKKQLSDKINSLATMMKEFEDASASMNGISGLGRIEQMQFKAERYSAERQVRKQIEKEVLNLAAIMQELQSCDDKVKEWSRLIELEKKVQELKNTVEDDKIKEVKNNSTDQRNIEFYTVKQSADLKAISALQEVYGNANAWKYIYDANRDKIVAPNSIIPAGTTLTIPNIKTDKAFINLE